MSWSQCFDGFVVRISVRFLDSVRSPEVLGIVLKVEATLIGKTEERVVLDEK